MNQNDSNIENINSSEVPLTNIELQESNNQEIVSDKKEFTLEDNIINIEIPEDALNKLETVVEPIPNVTPIPETPVIESETQTSMMVEKKKDDTTADSKGALPVFIIFGFFIVFIVAFPYISSYIADKEQTKKDQEFEEYKEQLNSTPSSTIEADTTNTFEDLYKACGTKEIFTTITIDYTKTENQCFKINLNNSKTFIEYVPATNESKSWSIYLGDKEIYTLPKDSTNTINNINIVNNNLELKEVDSLGNLITTHTFDASGNKITNLISEQ